MKPNVTWFNQLTFVFQFRPLMRVIKPPSEPLQSPGQLVRSTMPDFRSYPLTWEPPRAFSTISTPPLATTLSTSMATLTWMPFHRFPPKHLATIIQMSWLQHHHLKWPLTWLTDLHLDTFLIRKSLFNLGIIPSNRSSLASWMINSSQLWCAAPHREWTELPQWCAVRAQTRTPSKPSSKLTWTVNAALMKSVMRSSIIQMKTMARERSYQSWPSVALSMDVLLVAFLALIPHGNNENILDFADHNPYVGKYLTILNS